VGHRPDATPKEGPGSFREHDIEPFPGGLRPPGWTEVPVLIRDWLHDAQALKRKAGGTVVEGLATLHSRFDPGRLKAAKAPDGTWRSSTAWVEEYVASRYKRG
jgi:hypothetical protein